MKVEQLISELKVCLPSYKFNYQEAYPWVHRDKRGRFTSWHYDYTVDPDYRIQWTIRHPKYGKAVGYCLIAHELAEDSDVALLFLSKGIPEEYVHLVDSKK
jgi:hypothetical protein